jgi:hypothetical protein
MTSTALPGPAVTILAEPSSCYRIVRARAAGCSGGRASRQEANLGQLMLRCPMTDRNFSTGIDTDRKSLKCIPYASIAVRCPYCGLEHTLGPQDVPLGQSALPGKQIAPPMP